MKSPTKPVNVYVMTCQDRTKIGITSNVKKRRIGLEMSAGVPVRLHYHRPFYDRDAAGKIERELHRRFAEYRTIGEWFSIDPSIAVAALEGIEEPLEPVPASIYAMVTHDGDPADALVELCQRHLAACAKGYLIPEIAAMWRAEGIYEFNMSKERLKPAPDGWAP